MVKVFLKYITSLLLLSLIGILLLDYIIIPNYVGYNNEHYLPDVRGEYVEKASYQMRTLGFYTELDVVPYSEKYIPGTVIKMFPRAFTKVKEGRTINLTTAGQMEDVEIPKLINYTLRNAELEILRLGLGIDTIMFEYDSQVRYGKITFQLPQPGKIVQSSVKITLGVSLGIPPDYYIVPDVVNLSFFRAKEKISQSGLRVGDINYNYQPQLLNNTVVEQSMTAGMRVSFPASINLLVSTENRIKE